METPRQLILIQACVVELCPTAPFHFDGTVHKPSYFPTPDNAWQSGTYWRTLRLGSALYGLRLHDESEPPISWIRYLVS